MTDYEEFRDEEEAAHQFDDYGVFDGNGFGNDNYGDDGNWFDSDNNPWKARGRIIPMTSDGLDFELVDLGEGFPKPRAGALDSIAIDLGGEGIAYTGRDHNGDSYVDSIHRDEFSGHLYVCPREEDPSNPDTFPHLAEHTASDYDHNHGEMTIGLYDAMDAFDDEDMDLDDGGPTDEDLGLNYGDAA